MDIEVTPTRISDVVVIDTDFFQDERGFFIESYQKQRYAQHGIKYEFVQDNHSGSRRGVLRGFHYQDESAPMGKLVRCLFGEILDVAVDLRVGSPTFGQWVAIELTAANKRQLMVPQGFGHAFLTLSDGAEVLSKCTGSYASCGGNGGLERSRDQRRLANRRADPFAARPERHECLGSASGRRQLAVGRQTMMVVWSLGVGATFVFDLHARGQRRRNHAITEVRCPSTQRLADACVRPADNALAERAPGPETPTGTKSKIWVELRDPGLQCRFLDQNLYRMLSTSMPCGCRGTSPAPKTVRDLLQTPPSVRRYDRYAASGGCRSWLYGLAAYEPERLALRSTTARNTAS
jgi:dTDP-4-dehydrorhamnose 3,5-epimerase